MSENPEQRRKRIREGLKKILAETDHVPRRRLRGSIGELLLRLISKGGSSRAELSGLAKSAVEDSQRLLDDLRIGRLQMQAARTAAEVGLYHLDERGEEDRGDEEWHIAHDCLAEAYKSVCPPDALRKLRAAGGRGRKTDWDLNERLLQAFDEQRVTNPEITDIGARRRASISDPDLSDEFDGAGDEVLKGRIRRARERSARAK